MDYASPVTILLIGQPTLPRRPGSATWPPSTSASPCATTSPPRPDPRRSRRVHPRPPRPRRTNRHPLHRRRRPPIHARPRHARAINKLAITALLAAYSAGKTIADESSARTAITEDTTTD